MYGMELKLYGVGWLLCLSAVYAIESDIVPTHHVLVRVTVNHFFIRLYNSIQRLNSGLQPTIRHCTQSKFSATIYTKIVGERNLSTTKKT